MSELVGQTLGQYQIVEKIGQGGMGVVYKAWQQELERFVAVKVLPPHYAEVADFRERFLREARAIAKLEHPHILPVYDFGQQGEYTYLVMRYVEGSRSLAYVMRQPLSFQQVVAYLAQVAEGLDYAHRRGVIHRDIKPGNILLDGEDWLFLADFGLARLMETTTHMTSLGTGMVGTPAYMSPEQGSGGKVDGRTDVYAVGVVAFQMLTGQIPHLADTPHAIIYKRNTEPPPPLRSMNPAIPLAVEQAVQTALAPAPDNRFQSAGTFIKALQRAVEETGASQWVNRDVTLPEPTPAPSTALVCQRCGAKMAPGSTFCGRCGAALAPLTPVKVEPGRPVMPIPSKKLAATRPRRRRSIPVYWSVALMIGLGLFIAGIIFGLVEVIVVAVAVVVAIGGFYAYQHYGEWLS